MTGEYNVDIRAVDVGLAGADRIFELMDEAPEVVVMRGGLITKGDIKDSQGNYIYYLDGQRLTNKEYMDLINGCPESKYYYEKGCRQRKTGRILLITGGGCVITGVLIGTIIGIFDNGDVNFETGTIGGALLGVPVALSSIPFFAIGKHKKENAYQVYNEYCASKPTATLSFGPATKGIGMGVYLNF